MIEKRPVKTLVFLGVFGILLPVVTLVVELSSHMCAEVFFDPIPTYFHVFLCAFVPLANLQAFVALARDDIRHLTAISIANAVVIGISTFYALVFAPLTPLAIFALLYGIGVFPLAPVLSLIAAILARTKLSGMAHTVGRPSLPSTIPYIGGVLLSIVLAAVPSVTTRLHMVQATSTDEQQRADAVLWLRHWGDQDVMLRYCYVFNGRGGDIFSLLVTMNTSISPESAREVYYRATGTPFFLAPRPPGVQNRMWFDDVDPMWDENQGSSNIEGILPGLSLASSRLDGSLDADAALGYVEWTLEFANAGQRPREARARVQVPPGGVVSRVTLWVNGQEREAVFAGRKQVTEAYQKVVATRRDPILVTTAGPDRILVQCFPVPAGGAMKVRIGITFPLGIESSELATARLPYFIERNFEVGDASMHQVWFEAKHPFSTPSSAFTTESTPSGAFAVRGNIPDDALAADSSVLKVARDPAATMASTKVLDPKSTDVVRQTFQQIAPYVPSRVVLVVDGSASMRDVVPRIATALDALPDDIEVGLVAAGDTPAVLVEPAQGARSLVANALTKFACEGGRDNTVAVVTAWDMAAHPEGAIVWIHGPQPVPLAPVEGLIQRFERRPGYPLLYDVQVGRGPNWLLDRLDSIDQLRAASWTGDAPHDLATLFSTWSAGSSPHTVAYRERVPANSVPDRASVKQTSDHLARLWANDEVARLVARRTPADRDAAVALAAEYQLVTPVSGAVVLETDAQYAQSGLEPGGQDSIPSIPEPEFYALVLVALAALAWAVASQKRKRAWQ